MIFGMLPSWIVYASAFLMSLTVVCAICAIIGPENLGFWGLKKRSGTGDRIAEVGNFNPSIDPLTVLNDIKSNVVLLQTLTEDNEREKCKQRLLQLLTHCKMLIPDQADALAQWNTAIHETDVTDANYNIYAMQLHTYVKDQYNRVRGSQSVKPIKPDNRIKPVS